MGWCCKLSQEKIPVLPEAGAELPDLDRREVVRQFTYSSE
jgi:hypothetical protein